MTLDDLIKHHEQQRDSYDEELVDLTYRDKWTEYDRARNALCTTRQHFHADAIAFFNNIERTHLMTPISKLMDDAFAIYTLSRGTELEAGMALLYRDLLALYSDSLPAESAGA